MRATAPLTRFVAWVALGCHLLVAGGVPVPLAARDRAAGVAGKDRSRPFPCMDKPCGCATAEQCFANCCCHTPAQRLAWARAHRVEAAVLAALERRVAATHGPAGGCCTTRPQEPATCCSGMAVAAVDPEAPEVCGDYRSLAADPPVPVDAEGDPDDGDASRIVILRDMLACGGVLAAWLACCTTLPPPARVTAPTSATLVGVLALCDEVAPSVSAARDTPPPRAA